MPVMKRIIILTTSFPSEGITPGQEAAGSFVYDFAVNLSQYAEVTVIAPGKHNVDKNDNNVRIRIFPVPSLPLSTLNPANPLHWRPIVSTLNAGKRTLFSTLSEQSYDHVFALWALPSGYWAKQANSQFGVPYSIWALGSDIWSLSKYPVVRKILISTLKSASNVFADGLNLSKDVEILTGKRCDFLPSSRSLRLHSYRTASPKAPFKFAFLGRWHANKGIDILLDSLELLTQDTWDKVQEVRIYGGGALENYVKDQVKFLQSRKLPVSLGGYLGQQEAAELFDWTDYILIPSRKESIPVLFSDAVQLSKPIIATPAGDIPSLISKYGVGIVSEDFSPASFAKAISSACQSSPAKYLDGFHTAESDFNIKNIALHFFKKIR